MGHFNNFKTCTGVSDGENLFEDHRIMQRILFKPVPDFLTDVENVFLT